MNSRTEILTQTYKPEMAITVYKSGLSQYYLESHQISEDGRIMAGRPLLQDTIQAMVDVMFDERKNTQAIGGIIPDNLLSYQLLPGGKYKVVWFRPAEVRVVHFSEALRIPTGKAKVPAMIYCTDGRSMDVYAMKQDARPKENSLLYNAPFFNVNDQGDVCLGSAKVKKPTDKTYSAMMKYWEDLFWLSEFTHVNGNDKKTTTPLADLWRGIMKKKGKINWTSAGELKPFGKKTLKLLL